ncbi:NADH:ubiquinone oxidoreductase subunit NDUFA12 [Thermaurantiacus sp.]
MGLWSMLFRWWDGPTLGTALFTRRHGQEVGRDGAGNIYYQSKDGRRRWVIYAGENDASRVPPEWHLWLHHTRASPPTEAPLPQRAWERPWRPNPTGTPAAELPPGALAAGGRRPPARADYRAWRPGGEAGEPRGGGARIGAR